MDIGHGRRALRTMDMAVVGEFDSVVRFEDGCQVLKGEGLYSRMVEDSAQIKNHKPIDVVKYAVWSWVHALEFLH